MEIADQEPCGPGKLRPQCSGTAGLPPDGPRISTAHRTMVLTEDDYIQYLIELAGRRDLVPGEVRTALSESVLVFLGFQVEHWTFRACCGACWR